ncbi:MAG: YdcF family protein [Nanoarchaeales archaeon]|nr:YdcF family protein [Nanoarchaeales archaeon]
MLKDIYLVLGGEDTIMRPRTSKLIEVLKFRQQFNSDETKVIVSGKALFNRNAFGSEARDMKNYLVKENIPSDMIIVEDKGMDFVGCLLFSFYKINYLILKEQGDTVLPEIFPEITIHLIVEKFYMGRSKEIFKRIFKTLISLNPNVKFDFIESENGEEIPFLSNIKKNRLVKKCLKNPLLIPKDDRVSRELLLLMLVLLDINTFNLRTPKDFKRYLSLLPEYREIIMGKFSYDKAQAWYMLAINAFKNN